MEDRITHDGSSKCPVDEHAVVEVWSPGWAAARPRGFILRAGLAFWQNVKYYRVYVPQIQQFVEAEYVAERRLSLDEWAAHFMTIMRKTPDTHADIMRMFVLAEMAYAESKHQHAKRKEKIV